MEAIEQFRDAISGAGIEPPENIIPDGCIHRFPTNGSQKDDAGWYVLHLDGIAAGAFGCWRSNVTETWCAGSEISMTAEERAEYARFCENGRRERDAEQQKIWSEAAEEAKCIWGAAAEAADDFPYLKTKRVKSYGLKCNGDRLIVPMWNKNRELRSLQFIDSQGNKLFLKGGQTRGNYFSIGGPPSAGIHIAEGYATAATIHAVTGAPVVVAFNAGNLLPVAAIIRAKFEKSKVVICADDDVTEGNPGVTKAREAAAAIKAKVVIPDFGPHRPEKATDFNDMAAHLGLDRVREHLRSGATPPPAEEVEAPRPLMRDMPPADAFPADALGKVLGDAALAIHDRIRAPLAICGQAVLAAATLAVQGHADVVLPTGHRKPISNYFVTVAVTGERKSACDVEAMGADPCV